MYYFELVLTILLEVTGTYLMKLSNGFSNLDFSIGTLISYGLCFFFFSLCLKGIKLSIAYAIWGGAGIILTTLIPVFLFHEQLSKPQFFGIILILIGVIITNLSGGHN